MSLMYLASGGLPGGPTVGMMEVISGLSRGGRAGQIKLIACDFMSSSIERSLETLNSIDHRCSMKLEDIIGEPVGTSIN